MSAPAQTQEQRRPPRRKEDVFSNYLILKRLFCGVGIEFEELRNCRLVNKLWNFVACEALNSQYAPARLLSNDQDVDAFLSAMKGMLLSNETAEDDQKFQLPYSFYDLRLRDMTLESLQRFVKAVGPHVRKLSVRVEQTGPIVNLDQPPAESVSGSQMKVKITTLISNASKLKGLWFFTCDFPLTKYDLRRLPSKFPNLKSIYIRDLLLPTEGRSFFKTIVQRSPQFDYLLYRKLDSGSLAILPGMLLEPKRPKLPRLFLNVKLLHENMATLEELRNRGYNALKHFHVEMPYESKRRTRPLLAAIEGFVQLQGDSLQNLSVTCRYASRLKSLQLHLPTLAKLEHLVVDMEHSLYPLQPGQFPSLKIVGVDEGFPGSAHWLPPAVVFPHVDDLMMEQFILALDAPPPTLHFNFPNLAKLKLSIVTTAETLAYILIHLKALEDVDLGFGCTCDMSPEKEFWAAYTGHAPLQLAGDQMCGVFADTVNWSVAGPDTSSFAHLTRLKTLQITVSTALELQALVLMSRSGKMRRLEHLSICYTPRSAMVKGAQELEVAEKDFKFFGRREKRILMEAHVTLSLTQLTGERGVGGDILSK